MKSISTRTQPESSMQKEPSANATTYEPVRICDEVVFEMASLLYTQDKIAKRFKITRDTLMAKYGDAFTAGKESTERLSRALRAEAKQDMRAWRDSKDPVTDRQSTWADKEAPFDRMMVLTKDVDADDLQIDTTPSSTTEEQQASLEAWALANGFVKAT